MKKVIYTCITGNYDSLLQPEYICDDFDYICFCDDFDCDRIGIWQIRSIPSEITISDRTRKSRYVKILPDKVLLEYDYSIWIDANIIIKEKSFYDYINNRIKENVLIAQVPHSVPPVGCIYDEIGYCYLLNRVSFVSAFKQRMHLKRNNFPQNFGLFENNIILRQHNATIVKKISEEWWSEYIKYSKRDQFSLMYIYWKNDYMPCYLIDSQTCSRNTSMLEYKPHTKKIIDRHPFFLARIKRKFDKYSKSLLRYIFL